MKCICQNIYLYEIIDYIKENNLSLEEALELEFFGQYCKLCIPYLERLLKTNE